MNFNCLQADVRIKLKRLLPSLILTLLFSAFLPSLSLSQKYAVYSHESLAEKVYLQLDGKVYTTDQTIWFKSIVTNAIDHAPTALSGVLYVELIGPDEKIIEKKLIRIAKGIGDGFFDLNQNYPEGLYMIRAYTQWNKNFDPDFIFSEYIQMFAPDTKARDTPASHVTLVEKSEYNLDIQFFPESGELVHGIPGKVGFKALDYRGKGISIEGEIVTAQGEKVTSFKSNPLGMASFTLTRVDSAISYFARIRLVKDKTLTATYHLPDIARVGNVLSVMRKGQEIFITARSNYLKNDSIFLRASCRGMVYYDLKGRLRDGVLAISLPAGALPEGIIAFTMAEKLFSPVAERLYFNENPGNRLHILLSADQDIYAQRDPTRLNIETFDGAGEPSKANISVLVLNKSQLGQIQNTRQNILSWFLLSSDLKGEIENPGYYFSNSDRHDDLDALLLSQGWSRYRYTKPPDTIIYQPEARLTVSGSVSGNILRNKRKEASLTLMTFGKTRTVQTQNTDSLCRFCFDLNDEFGQNLNIVIQSSNHAGNKKDYSIELDKKESPAIVFKRLNPVESADSVVQTIIEKSVERKKVDDVFRLYSGDILLDEVVIEGYQLTPDRKKVMKEYGPPDEIISGKALEEKEEKWSYGLYSILLSKFPDKVIIRRDSSFLTAKVKGGEMTLVVIDGIPVLNYQYSLIPNIPPGEVSSFEIIENAKNFTDLYLKAFPFASPMDAPVWGSVIAIYTHGGKGIFGAKGSVGILHTDVPVYSSTKEFYAPRYEKLTPADWTRPDLRSLVHWAPSLWVDSLEKASVTYYNSDFTGEIQVVVEAISAKGEIGYEEIIYNVKKRQ